MEYLTDGATSFKCKCFANLAGCKIEEKFGIKSVLGSYDNVETPNKIIGACTHKVLLSQNREVVESCKLITSADQCGETSSTLNWKLFDESNKNWNEFFDFAISKGGRLPTGAELNKIIAIYGKFSDTVSI